MSPTLSFHRLLINLVNPGRRRVISVRPRRASNSLLPALISNALISTPTIDIILNHAYSEKKNHVHRNDFFTANTTRTLSVLLLSRFYVFWVRLLPVCSTERHKNALSVTSYVTICSMACWAKIWFEEGNGLSKTRFTHPITATTSWTFQNKHKFYLIKKS